MKFNRIHFIATFTILFLITIGWNIWLHTLPSHTTPWNLLYPAVFTFVFFIDGIISVVLSLRFGLRSNLGKMMMLMGIGMIIFWLTNIIWAYYTVILKVELPDSNPVDNVLIFLYLIGVVGFWYMLQLFKAQLTRQVIRDSLVIIFISFIFIFGLYALPVLSIDVPFVPNLTNAFFLFVDIVFVSIMLAILRIRGKYSPPSLYYFIVCIFFGMAGSIIYNYRTVTGTYWQGDISDLLFSVGIYLLNLGMVEFISSLYYGNTATVSNSSAVIHDESDSKLD